MCWTYMGETNCICLIQHFADEVIQILFHISMNPLGEVIAQQLETKAPLLLPFHFLTKGVLVTK